MIYDVSIPLDENTFCYPGDPLFKRTLAASLPMNSCNTSRLDFGAHTGTHIDAPLHMIVGGDDVEQFTALNLSGPARVIEISDPKSVTLKELKSKEIEGAPRLILKTRNSTLWSQGKFDPGYVYIEPDAGEYLASLGIQLLGFDYLSIERYGSKGHAVHLSLMKQKIVILEGLNLTDIKEDDYLLFCGPLRLRGSDGAPARVFLVDYEMVGSWLKAKP